MKMAVSETFGQLTKKINDNPTHIEGLNIVYQFNLSGDEEGTHQMKLANNVVEYNTDEKYDADITLEMSDKSFIKLADGDLNPTTAYMTGKLKVRGDLSLALKLNTLLKKYQGE